MIINDLDLGGDHPSPSTTVGIALGNALVMGSRTVIWSQGGQQEAQDLSFIVSAWQGLGGQPAGSMLAVRYRLRQLEQLAANPDLQPVYIQFAHTAQPGEFNVDTPHDGWYVIDSLQPDYELFEPAGWVRVRMTAKRVAAAAPSSLAVRRDGAALTSSYSAAGMPLVAFPIGSTGQAPTAGSRTGGEGAIPISTSPVPNPVPFVRPATIAGLFTGGCRVWDTVNTGSNPVPVAGGVYANANWIEVKGTAHDFLGDCVVTNGLQLLLYQVGQPFLPRVYLWNTTLATPTWQLIGDIEYADSAGNAGTLREVNLDKVGLQEVRVRATVQTGTADNWVMLKQKLLAGCYHTFCELWALTEQNVQPLTLQWAVNGTYATGFTDSASSTTFPSNLAPTTASGYAAAQGSAVGSPIFGFLFQNAPATGQGHLPANNFFWLGDTAGPAVGTFKQYGFFVVPYSGTVVLATAQAAVAPLFQQFRFPLATSWTRG